MSNAPQSKTALFRRGSWRETRRIGEVLREETIGGALLLAAAVVALAWANSPWSAAYESLRTLTVGPPAWHLQLDLATWAADGLLAVFFFVAGLELKREFTAGDLRDPRRAAVPVAAAVGGVIVPALAYTAFTAGAGGGALKGWAIPGATDIAFALAVLAVAGRHLPTALRAFLLTLAVVDDLLAIVIIAVFYTSAVSVLPLVTALVPLAAFAVLVRRRPGSWWLLLPMAVVTWALVHASGVHATVAGVLLAFTVPVLRRAGRDGPGTGPGPAGDFEHRLRPVSAGLAVPVFALLSAGVTLGGLSGMRTALSDPVALGVVAGLVAGKAAGIFAATWLVARFTRATLGEGLSWTDVAGVALLGGVGFTVSLLISELAFGTGGGREDHAKVAVLTGSLIAALLATIVLRLRNRAYRRIEAAESPGTDRDGIPPGARKADLGHREPAGSRATRSPGTAQEERLTVPAAVRPASRRGHRAARGSSPAAARFRGPGKAEGPPLPGLVALQGIHWQRDDFGVTSCAALRVA
ncbi:MAG TPA: Na+/H+ antiporter NhaA [Streptosporangiaceae bacterium]|nr:Na+/H+ antiporter NhaA [Streptosporangiaceae bacterium]